MTIQEIYAEFSVGSAGFVQAVEENCGYGISAYEIKRIASRAASADQFKHIWENEDWWTDTTAA